MVGKGVCKGWDWEEMCEGSSELFFEGWAGGGHGGEKFVWRLGLGGNVWGFLFGTIVVQYHPLLKFISSLMYYGDLPTLPPS